MRWPLDRVDVSQGYRPPDNPNHAAIDLRAATGTTIKAPASGKVIAVNRTDPNYIGGLYVIVRQNASPNYEHYMGHMSKVSVKVGQAVNGGQKVGEVGSTGLATGPHVHYQIRKKNGGELINPQNVLKKEERDDMITEKGLTVLFRHYTGKDPRADQFKTYVGKISFDDMRKKIMSWPSYKNDQARAKAGTLNPVDHLPGSLRDVYKAPAASKPTKTTVLAKGLYEVK